MYQVGILALHRDQESGITWLALRQAHLMAHGVWPKILRKSKLEIDR